MFKFLMEEANGEVSGGAAGSGGAAAPANIGDTGSAGGAGAGGQPVGDGAGNAGGGGTNDGGWLATLPEDVRDDPSLKVFKDVSGLAKSYVNAQKMIGADKVLLPNEKSTDEEWSAFHQKLGRPESPDKYEIKLGDGQALDENFAKGFKETAFKAGLSTKQVAGMAEWYAGAVKSAVEAEESAKVTELRQSLSDYSQKLGGEEKYKARVEDARVAVRALLTPEQQEYLKKSGQGSRPEMIEIFATLKAMMSEDKIRDGTTVPFGAEDPTVLQKELEAIEQKMFSDVLNPRVQEWSEQAFKLRERLISARQRPSA